MKTIVLIVAWFVAFVGYTGFRDLLRLFREHKNRPQLVFSIQEPVYTEARAEEGRIVRFYHLRVQNTGRSSARNCCVRLMAVWKGQQQDNVLGTGDVPLHWAHRPLDEDSRSVPPAETAELDLVTQEREEPSLLCVFGTRQIPDGLLREYGPGSYRLRLRLTADNVQTQDLRITVDHCGSWEEPATLAQQ